MNAEQASDTDIARREVRRRGPNTSFPGFANNHGIHHRGQLAAYLRAMGSKVPDIYGPSADSEKSGG